MPHKQSEGNSNNPDSKMAEEKEKKEAEKVSGSVVDGNHANYYAILIWIWNKFTIDKCLSSKATPNWEIIFARTIMDGIIGTFIRRNQL